MFNCSMVDIILFHFHPKISIFIHMFYDIIIFVAKNELGVTK